MTPGPSWLFTVRVKKEAQCLTPPTSPVISVPRSVMLRKRHPFAIDFSGASWLRWYWEYVRAFLRHERMARYRLALLRRKAQHRHRQEIPLRIRQDPG